METETSDHSVAAALSAVYDEIRQIAAWLLARERHGHSFQPTALAHEAIARVLGRASLRGDSRAHTLATVARTMRCVLVDHARRKAAQKRQPDGIRSVPPESLSTSHAEWCDVLAIEEALQKLDAVQPRSARVVELHFFAGLTFPEIAPILSVSRKTVVQDWTFARAWLSVHLEEP